MIHLDELSGRLQKQDGIQKPCKRDNYGINRYMWDPKVYSERIRHQNMSKKFERANDIVKRVTKE